MQRDVSSAHFVLLAFFVLFSAATFGCHGNTKAPLQLPLYFGFFPDSNATELGLKQLAWQGLQDLLSVDEVRQLYCQYTNHSLDTPAANLSRYAYSNPTQQLHVTSFYCNHGLQPGCVEYATRPEVLAATGHRFGLNVTGLLLTPRTLGFRVELGPAGLAVWANGEGEAAPGQRAHFTVATAPGVPAVQTGLDLLAVANKVARPVPGRLPVLNFQRAQFLLLLRRRVEAEFRASDSSGAVGLRPSWLALLAAPAWRLLRRLRQLLEGW